MWGHLWQQEHLPAGWAAVATGLAQNLSSSEVSAGIWAR